MHIRKASALSALVLAGTLGFSACGDYLEGEGITTDPNRPSTANVDQLFSAVQVRQFIWHTGHIPRTAGMWTQQWAGTDRQYITIDAFEITEGDFSPQFSQIYSGGGLIDMRRIQSRAAEANDRTYGGIAKVWEAYLIGTAASIWGAIPYSQAVGEAEKPGLDSQAEVYAAVQALLDEAIADLQSNQGPGPGSRDLVYSGNRGQWIQAANTLKARFHLHLAGVQPARYQQAFNAAQTGISTPANNFRTFHTAAAGEENIWHQFIIRERDSYMRAGRNFVQLLQERNDPRLAQYFSPVGNQFAGSRPATGADFATSSTISATRGAANFNQPLITYAETQLIMAEAAFRTAQPGVALTHLNNVRSAAGLGAIAATGDALLREILTEKHIAVFQTVEVWNDYKRTCFPNITPPQGRKVPGRLYYGSAERNVNPNIPRPAEQQQRNANDPGLCTAARIGGT
jgi:hypothetical protein